MIYSELFLAEFPPPALKGLDAKFNSEKTVRFLSLKVVKLLFLCGIGSLSTNSLGS